MLMKRIVIFIMLYITIYCSLECSDSFTDEPTPDACHKIQVDKSEYCCYYEGKNLDTNQKEKACWAFAKTLIDDDKIDDTIEAIEKGTDSHVTKKHSDVELDCFSFYEKINYLLIALLIVL